MEKKSAFQTELEVVIFEIAIGLVKLPALQEEMNTIYYEDKYRYYDVAKSSQLYTNRYVHTVTLEAEAAYRRNIGVLLASISDDLLFMRLRKILVRADWRLPYYVNNPISQREIGLALMNESHSNSSFYSGLFHSAIAAFLIQKSGEYPTDKVEICQFMQVYANNIMEYFENEEEDQIPLSALRNLFKFSKDDWNIINSIRNADQIVSYRLENPIEFSKTKSTSQIDINTDHDEMQELLSSVFSYYEVLMTAGVTWEGMFKNRVITKEDQRSVLQCMMSFSLVKGGCRPHQYVTGMMMYLLAREMCAMRDYFWEHNEETQYLETKHLDDLNKSLREENKVFRKRIEELTDKLAKVQKEDRYEVYSVSLSYREEIEKLKREVTILKEEAEEHKKVIYELHALRELALSDKEESQLQVCNNEYVDEELRKISDEKKVFVIGGHTNWRNKLKAKFPRLEIYDGTNANLDLKRLESADLFVFYTYNMAHSVYERVIAYIRQNNIPCAYLKRTTSLELLSFELLKLLKEEFSN